MFKLQVQVILTALVIIAVNAGGPSAVVYRGNMKHPDLPNHCYYAEHKLSIPVNETIYPTGIENVCIDVFCRDDFVLLINICPAPSLDCISDALPDHTKPFPKCCPAPKCRGKVN